jgi:hypothetical protein
MPCAKCNPSSEDKPPRLPKGSSPTQSSASRLKTTARNAYIRTMPSKHIELPPRVAQTFVRDMRSFETCGPSLRQKINLSRMRSQRAGYTRFGLSAPAGEEAAARGCESDVRADEGSRVKGEKWRANHGKLEWVGASSLAGSWPIAMHRQAKPYSCPSWADEQVYALAFLQGKCRTTQGPLRKR